MTEKFVPVSNNPPAKVKDAGLAAMAMDGACVYNAKSGEVIFLPKGAELAKRLEESLTNALFEKCGAQPIDATGAFDSVRSLAERYVREHGERALRWTRIEGRNVVSCGWAASKEDATAAARDAAEAVNGVLTDYLTEFSFVETTEPAKLLSLKAIAPSVKGALYGEDGFKCPSCGAFVLPDTPGTDATTPVNADAAEEPLTDVHTPGTHTITLLCEYLHLDIKNTLKAMLYTVEKADGGKELLFAMIRGDLDVSIAKLGAYVQNKFPHATFRRAEASEIVEAFGEVAGFCGPVGVPDNVNMVADLSLVGGKNFVVGGNRPDYHRTGCCWGRDFEPQSADLVLYEKSSACPKCGAALDEANFREVCAIDAFEAEAAGENALVCRDRDGEHKWPYRWNACVSLESLLFALYENGKRDTI